MTHDTSFLKAGKYLSFAMEYKIIYMQKRFFTLLSPNGICRRTFKKFSEFLKVI